MPNTSASPGSAQADVRLDGPHVRRLFHLAKRRHARIELLTGEILWLPYEKDTTTVLDLFSETCKYCSVGEPDFFGLATYEPDLDWYQFIDLSEKVTKFKRKRSAPSRKQADDELDVKSNAPMFHFRLAYYVPCHVLPRDRGTKRQYYMQLRRNVREYSLLQKDDQLVSLMLFALQADFGPFGPHLLTPSRSHTPTPTADCDSPCEARSQTQLSRADRYFDPARYFPRWMVDKFGDAYFLTHVPPLHAGLASMSRSEAEFRFIRECSTFASYSYNMHLYHLQLQPLPGSTSGWFATASAAIGGNTSLATRPQCDNVWLGISANGLELFERTLVDSIVFRSHVSSIAWHEIGKLRFKKTRLEVRVLVESGARSDAAARRPVSASLHVEQLQVANLTVRGDPLPFADLSSASPSSSTSVRHSTTSVLAERMLLFCTDSTAISAQILELTKLQHVFQLKASLRAPQSADAVELAERARYRETLVSAASMRSRERNADQTAPRTTARSLPPSVPCPLPLSTPPGANYNSNMATNNGEVESGLGTLEEPERDSPSADSNMNRSDVGVTVTVTPSTTTTQVTA